MQKKSPVGSYIRPTPGNTEVFLQHFYDPPCANHIILGITPGYGDEVIFADGTFTDGSTLELSADGPLREPFVAFTQGAIHWSHWALVIEEVLRRPEFNEN